MHKPLALFDIDNTMFNSISYFSLLDAQVAEGLIKPEVAIYADEALQRYKDARLGYEDLVKELFDMYAQGLKRQPADEVAQFTNDFFEKSSEFFGYVQPTIDLLAPGHEIVLVTGNSQFTAGAVAKVFGIQQFCSTELGVKNNRMTGLVSSYLATRHEKREAIRHLTKAHPYAGSFAFGDSEGDIEMLRVVEHPVCINPTAGLRKIADEKGWAVIDSQDELASELGLPVIRRVLAQG